ncbi:MAG: hypothetical protein IPG71_11265 [bacterium]|nr:hypothetical protein [bacterium]
MGGDSLTVMVKEINGVLSQSEPGRFEIRARGNADYPVGMEARVDATVWPEQETVSANAHINIQDGDLRLPGLPFDSVASNGGSIEVYFEQDTLRQELRGEAQINGIELQARGQSIFVPEARLTLNDGAISASTLRIVGQGLEALVNGSVSLVDSMRISCSAKIEVRTESALSPFGVDARGLVTAQAELTGLPEALTATATIRSDSVTWRDNSVREIGCAAVFRNDSLIARQFRCTTDYGTLDASGVVTVFADPQVMLTAVFEPQSMPRVLGAASSLKAIQLSIEGDILQPGVHWSSLGAQDDILGEGDVNFGANEVSLSFAQRDGQSGAANITFGDGQIAAHVADIQALLVMAYPELDSLLGQVTETDLSFRGNADHGELKLEIVGDTISNTALSNILNRLEFDGRYERAAESSYGLSGEWHGTTRSYDDFFGRGHVSITDGRISVTNLYIDEAGELSGEIKINPLSVDLQLSIDALPLDRTPFAAEFAEKWKLAGVVSGEITANGPVDSLAWYADISLIDGVAQGLPGYWALATAHGVRDAIDTMHVSFGRDVRSIFEAEGRLSVPDNFIDVRAVFPTSEASDFLQALTGRGGLLTGELEGDLLVTGKLSAPEVLASLRVLHGELFSELTVDRFAIDASLTTEVNGKRLLAIPQLSFHKENEYRFYAELATEPTRGGSFQAMLEGSGDFLDLLEQVDADFTSQGSTSGLRLDFGGSWDAPAFAGGQLTIDQGVFTYPPAAPGDLGMQVLIKLNQSGVVDTGFIQVREGHDGLRLDFLPSTSDAAFGLNSLVIPKPRIELGTLRLSTGNDGVLVRLPGFMKPEWLGRLTTGADTLEAITLSAFDSTRLLIQGDANLRDGRFTFPFLSYGGGTMRPVTKWLVDRLYEAQWNLDISAGKGVHYDVEITGFKDSDLFTLLGKNALLGTVAEYVDHISVDANVTPSELPLGMRGSIMDSSLRLIGKLEATSGSADYLDQTFWIEALRADFDETDIFPIISGRSATYGVDSVGRTVPVYLTIYEIEDETQTRVPFGRFEDVTYVLEADGYPDPEQVLGLLGYDVTNFSQGKAEQLLTRTAMTAAKRIWLDPIARRLERATFLDQISLAPGGGASASLFRAQRENVLTDTLESQGVVRLLRGSHVTVGKYLTSDVFVTYTGELAEASAEVEGGRLGLIHFWNLQYRVVPVSRDFVLDFAVEYDEASRRRDESVALKYSFVLEP